MRRTTVSRFVPENSMAVKCTIVEAVAYCYERTISGTTWHVAVAYRGKRSKADWHYRYRTTAERSKKMQGLIAWENRKRAYRAERSKPHTLKAGQVLRSCWGYDQTNIDYYEVTNVIGRNTVEIRQIGQKLVGNGGPRELVVPHVGNYIGKAMRKRARSDNTVRITSYADAYPYDGMPASQTGAGWGH